MGRSKIIHWFSFFGITSILFLGTISTAPVSFADDHEKRASLRDLGVLQLVAHDLFNVDRTTEIDHENGKLDLSTLLDHGQENISLGGEPRNRENVILFTVSSEFGNRYLDLIANGQSPNEARQEIVRQYHEEFKLVYEKTFEEDFPLPMEGSATQTENLAFRTIHDFLPGEITVGGVPTATLDQSLIGTTLSDVDLQQSSSKLDGVFDPEFLNITIFIPGIGEFTINLLERDSSFAAQFNTEFTFETFLLELQDGSYDTNDEVMKQIRNLISKSLNFLIFERSIETPLIILKGTSPTTVDVGATFRDEGAIAIDNIDGYITSWIVRTTTVNTASPGSFSVTYNVMDSDGNAATPVIRQVKVEFPPPPGELEATAPCPRSGASQQICFKLG